MRYGPWTMTDPTLRLPSSVRLGASNPASNNVEVVRVLSSSVAAPAPAAIAAFLDVVRRLNNSVTWGEVEPAAGVWRWLEGLAR